jgi:rod shape-determining protein MreC
VQKNVIRRRRITALALFAASIILLTAYFSGGLGGSLRTLQKGVIEVLSPIQDLASGAIKPVRDLVNWVGDSFDAKDENEQLKRDLLDARVRLARLSTAEAENEQLRKLARFDKSDAFPAGYEPVGARVIARSPSAWYATVTIDKGRSDGVRVNQPVINGDGLVGRVTTTTRDAAQVTLITDPSSGVAAIVPGPRILGIVRARAGGEATAEDLYLDFIRQRGELRPRSQVVTAGEVTDPDEVPSVFPSGIPIGEITKVDPEERDLYQRVHMRPYADMRALQLVQVLVPQDG